MHSEMKNRPGERSRLEIRRAWRSTARKNVIAWVCLILFGVIFCETISMLPLPSLWRAFLFGFVTASGLACLAWMIHVMSGAHSWSLGKLGEEATAEAVAGWKQRRKGWRLINGIYLSGHGDVDHVLVGPGGAFVIESKWTSNPCRIENGGIEGLLGREPVAQARDGARKVERLLRHGPKRFDIKVKPVVVIWGPGAMSLDEGWTVVDGVLVCEGRRDDSWVQQLTGHTMERSEIESIAEVLEEQITRQVDQPTH